MERTATQKAKNLMRVTILTILAVSLLTAASLFSATDLEAGWSSHAISESEVDPQTGDPFPRARFGAPPQAEVGTDGPYAGLGAPGLNHEATRDPVYGRQQDHSSWSARTPAGSPGLAPTPKTSARFGTRAPIQGHATSYRESSIRLQDLPKDPSLAAAIRTKGVQEVSIIAGDLGYFPKTVFVAPDIPVRMYVTGASKKPLCILLDSFNVRKQVRSQKIEEVFFTPSAPGKYRYYCPINGIEGSLIVKDTLNLQGTPSGGETQASHGEEEESAHHASAGEPADPNAPWWSWPTRGSSETGKSRAAPQRSYASQE